MPRSSKRSLRSSKRSPRPSSGLWRPLRPSKRPFSDSQCQFSGKIGPWDENRRPSTYKRPGGPGRGPGTPVGSLGGVQKSRGSFTIQSTSSLVRNADARNLASPGSLHRYIVVGLVFMFIILKWVPHLIWEYVCVLFVCSYPVDHSHFF